MAVVAHTDPCCPLLCSGMLCPPRGSRGAGATQLMAKGHGLMPFLYLSITCSPRQVRIQGICISLNHSPQSCSFWGKRIWAGPDAFTPSFQEKPPG